jgi:hypothetical protein
LDEFIKSSFNIFLGFVYINDKFALYLYFKLLDLFFNISLNYLF